MNERIEITSTNVSIIETWDNQRYVKIWPPSQDIDREYLERFGMQIFEDYRFREKYGDCVEDSPHEGICNVLINDGLRVENKNLTFQLEMINQWFIKNDNKGIGNKDWDELKGILKKWGIRNE